MIHWNDTHRLTREEIAERVARIEDRLAAAKHGLVSAGKDAENGAAELEMAVRE